MTPSVDDLLTTRANEIEGLYELSSLLNVGLDRRTLAVLLDLIERGVHPEALADIVADLRGLQLNQANMAAAGRK